MPIEEALEFFARRVRDRGPAARARRGRPGLSRAWASPRPRISPAARPARQARQRAAAQGGRTSVPAGRARPPDCTPATSTGCRCCTAWWTGTHRARGLAQPRPDQDGGLGEFDIGPEGGDGGGALVAAGTPEARWPASRTATPALPARRPGDERASVMKVCPPVGSGPGRIGVLGCADIARRRTLPALAPDPGSPGGGRGQPGRRPSPRGWPTGTLCGRDGLRPPARRPGRWRPSIARCRWPCTPRGSRRALLGEQARPSARSQADRRRRLHPPAVRAGAALGLVLAENFMFPTTACTSASGTCSRIGAIGDSAASPGSSPSFPAPLPPGDIRYDADLGGGAPAGHRRPSAAPPPAPSSAPRSRSAGRGCAGTPCTAWTPAARSYWPHRTG